MRVSDTFKKNVVDWSRIKSYVEYWVAKRLACRCGKPVPGISRTCPVIAEKRRLKARFFTLFFYVYYVI